MRENVHDAPISGRSLRVLVIEDVEADAELLLLDLTRAGYAVEARRVDTAEALASALDEETWDIAISDYTMPELDALAAVRIVEQRGLDLPVIVVSGSIQEEMAVAALKAGAKDYLSKGSLLRLVPAVEREIREARGRAELRKAEAARQLSDERLRIVARATNDVFWDWDIAADECWVSEGEARVPFEAWVNRIHPEDRGRIRSALDDALASGRHVWSAEYRFQRGDGTFADVLDRGSVVRDQDGRAERVVSSLMDVSERNSAEAARLAAERSFRSLIEASPDFVIVHRDDRVVYANPAADTGLGYGAGGLIGLPVLNLAHPDERAMVAERLLKIRSGSPTLPTEQRWLRSDGSELVVEVNGQPIVYQNEEAVLAIARDLTDRKRVHAQLLVSDRMASVGMLAAGVAHEINNPLAAVITNVDLALEDLGKVKRRVGVVDGISDLEEGLRDAQAAADRVRQIVRDVKIFSRGGDDEKITAVDLRRVMESSLRMAWNEIRHRARLIRSWHEVPSVRGSESRLGQVFLNLLINAAHAIPEGAADENEIRVTIRVENANRVCVDVTDTGSGMSKDVLRRLFTPFFTTKPLGVGTGLGLSICQRIVYGFGGEIRVESALGKGTTVRVVLPVAYPLATSDLPPVSVGEKIRRRARVLIVEDDTPVAKAIARHLGRVHDVQVVDRARLALDMIRSGEAYDVILSDLMMPDMTGMDLHGQLMQLAGGFADRMIFMTGGAFTPAARDFLDRVANPRIEKPFDLRQVLTVIDERIARARGLGADA